MLSTENQRTSTVSMLRGVMIAFSMAGTIFILHQILKYSDHGVDFTDESFYLIWMRNPFIYEASVTQFGFIYHPLFVLFDGDISVLRRANIIMTFGLAWIFVIVFIAKLVPEIKNEPLILHATATGFATSSLIIFDSWLLTPNYNGLALHAMLIASIGLLLAEKNISPRSVLGWVIMGIGGWLSFMAKPSTALALAVGVFVYLIFSGKFSFRLLFLAAASAVLLLFASALWIDGSAFAFVERIRLGMELGRHLDSGHTLSRILRVDGFQFNKGGKFILLLILYSAFLAVWGLWTENWKGLIVGFAVSLLLFLLTIFLMSGNVDRTTDLGRFQGLLIFGVVFATIFARVALDRSEALSGSQWAMFGLFLAMPHIYAFGTNGNYWQTGSSAAVFWLAAGLVFSGSLVRRRGTWMVAMPLVLATQTVTAALLQTGFEKPYRQPQPLRLNTSVVKLGPHQSELMLSRSHAEYIAGVMTVSENADFRQGTPMIDLSGRSPGAIYILGAESLGQAWNIGGYPGSLSRATAALNRVGCEKIAAAWILIEPDGPRRIPMELLTAQGLNFYADYQVVGDWLSAETPGRRSGIYNQYLYAPRKIAENVETCRATRGY